MAAARKVALRVNGLRARTAAVRPTEKGPKLVASATPPFHHEKPERTKIRIWSQPDLGVRTATILAYCLAVLLL